MNQNMIGDECEQGEDQDHDGFLGGADNCPRVFNANQQDLDGDGERGWASSQAEGTSVTGTWTGTGWGMRRTTARW